MPSSILSTQQAIEALVNKHTHVHTSSSYLFDGDSRFPVLFFVENAQAYSAARIDVGMKESSWKFTYNTIVSRYIFFLKKDTEAKHKHLGGLLG